MEHLCDRGRCPQEDRCAESKGCLGNDVPRGPETRSGKCDPEDLDTWTSREPWKKDRKEEEGNLDHKPARDEHGGDTSNAAHPHEHERVSHERPHRLTRCCHDDTHEKECRGNLALGTHPMHRTMSVKVQTVCVPPAHRFTRGPNRLCSDAFLRSEAHQT